MPRIIKAGVAGLWLGVAPAAFAAEAAERLPGNQDALAAFVALVIATLVGASLAAKSAGLRNAGLWTTAILLLGGAVLLGIALQAGYPADPVKPQTPLDPFKHGILSVFVAGAASGGVFLAFAAARPAGQIQREPAAYDQVSRFLHWTTALIVVALVAEGLFMAGLHPDVAIRGPLYVIHKSLGFTVFGLVILRIIWHRLHKLPALSADLGRANRIAAKTAHILLYVVMLGFPLTGYYMSTLFGKAALFYWIDLPVFHAQNKELALPFGISHKMLLPLIFYTVFAAHVAGVIKHHFIDKHREAIRRMFG